MPKKARPAEAREVYLIEAEDVEEEIARFLVPKRVPLNEITLLAGETDIGKGTWFCQLVAELSHGNVTPDGEPKTTLIASTEDSIKHTLRPRLRAAGADLSRVAFVAI